MYSLHVPVPKNIITVDFSSYMYRYIHTRILLDLSYTYIHVLMYIPVLCRINQSR